MTDRNFDGSRELRILRGVRGVGTPVLSTDFDGGMSHQDQKRVLLRVDVTSKNKTRLLSTQKVVKVF